FIFTGGDSVKLDLVYGLKQVFPKSKTNIVYGSTEVFPISWIDIDEIIDSKDKIIKKTGAMCLGKPHPDLKIRIIKPVDKPIVLNQDDIDKITLKDGEIGEIIISGDHVVKNYFGDRDKTVFNRNKIVDKNGEIWHRTGDLGYIAKNEIWFIGRTNC
ncbi:AMP-dependent synthetase, partial [bacterium]